MRLFNNVKGYATQKGAIRKLKSVLGSALDDYQWSIGVNDEGRFYPIVHNSNSKPYVHLVGRGICVT
jgi:hypothetical protein